jgi:hypothetical protein
MDAQSLPTEPPPPTPVITDWESTRGLDLLGLRAPAERIAVEVLNGVTTVSPLTRYLGFRSWIIQRYVSLEGPDDRKAFYRFAGKCEAALVVGHKIRGDTTGGLVGSRTAAELARQDGAISIRRLTQILAIDLYAGPSVDLGIGIARTPVPALSTERGQPLAVEVGRILNEQPALGRIDVDSEQQEVDAHEAEQLAAMFDLRAPAGHEREILIDAVAPSSPQPGELARLAAYAYLLRLVVAAPDDRLDGDAVFRAAIADDMSTPPGLHSAADGWLRFLIRDLLVAIHERAASAAISMLNEAPNQTASPDQIASQMAALDLAGPLEAVGLPGITSETPIGRLVDAVSEAIGGQRHRAGLCRWDGPLDELQMLAAMQEHPGPEAVALLPVAWLLAYNRAHEGLADPGHSLDAWSGAHIARIGIGDVIAPAVSSWQGSGKTVGEVVGDLVRRSVEQHLSIAWHRLQIDPTRNVSAIESDGAAWTSVGWLFASRATSRIYQAINWLKQLDLIGEEGVTADGQEILNRSLATLAMREATP